MNAQEIANQRKYYQRSWTSAGHRLETKVRVYEADNGHDATYIIGLVDGEPPRGWNLCSHYVNSENYQFIKMQLENFVDWLEAERREAASV